MSEIMKAISLSRLEKVDLRDIWVSEPQDFTPWLAQEENLTLLAETLNLDLQLVDVEKNVGPFRADILCKDRNSDRLVLIENQLETSDHVHLGQILTYAAGCKTNIMIWIVKKFTDEHRAALDWLNSLSETGEIHFFGVEIELWKIENSNPAPKFNIVIQPNGWKNQIAKTTQMSVERRPVCRFSLAKIPLDAVLHFKSDQTKTCRVLDDERSIEFEGQRTTLSAATSKLLGGGAYQGTRYWTYEGESVDERRRRFDKETTEASFSGNMDENVS